MRLLCEHYRRFGQKINPCRKVLADVKGNIIEQSEGEVVVSEIEELTLKCSTCGKKTKIKLGGKKNG